MLSRVARGEQELALLRARSADVAAAAHNFYEEAQSLVLARRTWLAEVRIWLTGAEIEAAWSAVHAAEELLILIQSEEALRAELPALAAEVRARMPATDDRAVAYLAALSKAASESAPEEKPVAGAPAMDRAQLRAMRRTLNQINDDAHARIRSFRNVALGITVALTVVAIVLAFDPPGDEWLPVCAPADASGTTPECASVAQIEVVGALGGLLAVVAALFRFQGFSGPYALPGVMTILKVPAGALTGLLGAIWMQSEVFGFKAQPGGKILAYAALFGFAQQALTTFADRQAGQLLGQAQGTAKP